MTLIDVISNPQVQSIIAGIFAWALQRWAPFIPGNDGSETWRKKTWAIGLAVIGAFVISVRSGDWMAFVLALAVTFGTSQTAYAMANKGSAAK